MLPPTSKSSTNTDAVEAPIPARASWRFLLLVAALVVTGVVAYRPALSVGYISDDYLQNAMLDGEYAVPRSPLDLYSFVKPGELPRAMDRGTVPWWSHPELNLSAFRPLSSALLWVDHRLLGLSAYARHVHSLLWWAAIVCAFPLLCRELLSPRIAVFATILFALDPAHLIPILWIANRTALVSAFFGLFGLIHYVRFRKRGARRSAVLSGVGFALALAGGEYGLCALAYVAAYELFVSTGPPRERLKATLPAALPALVYALLYALLGFGARASAAYVSPLSAPREFIREAAVRLPALLANELLMVPPELVFPALMLDYTLLIVFVLMLVVIGLLIYGTVRRANATQARVFGFFGVGMLLSLLPLIGTIPGTRLLLIPSVGGSVLLGALFTDAWSRLSERAERRRPLTWARLLATLPLLLFHLVLAAPLSAVLSKFHLDVNRLARKSVTEGDIDDRIVAQQDLIVINAPDPMNLLYVPHMRKEQNRPPPRVWRALSMTPRPVRVRRVAPNALELSVVEGSLTEMPLAALVRRPDLRFHPNETILLERMSVRVLEVGRRGPRRVRYDFSANLDSDAIRVLVLSARGLKRMAPLPIGSELVVPGLDLRLPGI
jgi:hypothetical protein